MDNIFIYMMDSKILTHMMSTLRPVVVVVIVERELKEESQLDPPRQASINDRHQWDKRTAHNHQISYIAG